MKRKDVLEILSEHRDELHSMGVSSLALFGSVARGEEIANSDVDLLVEFDRPLGLFQFYRVQQYIESILQVPKVDLVMRKAVVEELRDIIFAEALPCL